MSVSIPAGDDPPAPATMIAALTQLVAAIRAETLAAQEEMQRAALAAVRAAEQERRQADARFRTLFHQAAAGIGMLDMDGRVVDGNETWTEQMGYTIEEMRGRPIVELVTPGSEPAALAGIRQLLDGTRETFRLEFTHVRRDGRPYVLDLSVSRVRAAGAGPDFLVGVSVDVTERKRLEERLRYEARHDPLTGLPNRTMFFERLDALLADPARAPHAGVCYLDLDGFKNINDGLGHDVGDRLLVQVARRMQGALAGTTPAGTPALLARLGGDEFGILSDGTDGPPCAQAERVLDVLARPFTVDGRQVGVSASVGVVDAPAGTDARKLMRAADISLYQAKAQGRGRLALHDPHADADHVTWHTLATELPTALARGELFLEYQPLVSLADNSLTRVEALLRWRHPVLGLVPPDRFVTLAEENGRIVDLGRWVLATACRAAAAWYARCPATAVGVNVNVAVGQLHDAELPGYVAAVLDETGLPADMLHLELTESAVLGGAPGPVEVLNELVAAGVGLVIDDFGTGYSNLAHLTRLPVSELKVAASFLPAVPKEGSPHDKILPAVISLAHSLEMRVTAEGVENAAQVDLLRDLRCDTAQGWYFGAAMPADEIGALLVSRPGAPPWRPAGAAVPR